MVGNYIENNGKLEKKNEIEILQMIEREENLEKLLMKLPKDLGKVLQSIHFPGDNGERLFESLIDGNLVRACDGSLVNEHEGTRGGFSFSLQQVESDEGRIVGCALVPGSNDMTSLTTEMYGILATIICSFLVWKQHYHKYPGIKSFPSITVYSDNKEAIGKANEEKQRFNTSEFLKPEYDLEKLIWDFQNILPFKVKHQWIKGHQNETKTGEPIYGPFLRPVQLNIEMDGLAKAGCSLPPMARSIYSHTKIAI